MVLGESQGFQIFDLYVRMVKESQELGSVKVRRSFYMVEVMRRLDSFGSPWLWLSLLLLSLVGVVGGSYFSGHWAELLALVCVTLLSYGGVLIGAGSLVQLYPLVYHQPPDSELFSALAARVYNRFTLFIVPPILIILVVVFFQISTSLATNWVTLNTMLALLPFLLSVLTWTFQLFVDYREIVRAIQGKKTVVTRTTTELVVEIGKTLRKNSVNGNERPILSQLADNDLRNAEVRLQLVNLTLAMIAILISIALSQQLTEIFVGLLRSLDTFFYSFGQAAGNLLLLTGSIRQAFAGILYVVLWLLVVNFILGGGYVALTALLSFYFSSYRPAYALHQALILVVDDIVVSQPTQTLRQTGIINKLLRIFLYTR